MRTLMSTGLLFITFFLFTILLSCQSNSYEGWQASREAVSERQQQQPEYIWRESDVPDYSLPDPLLALDGTPVHTREEWRQRRMEILGLFRDEMYGHRPGPPDDLQFSVTREDETAMDGNATLRQVEIRSTMDDRTHTFELILFLPNHTSEPAPVFLLMNNRSRDNTDPAREEQSGFWPAEEVIGRGYGIAAIQNSDLASDDDEEFQNGVIRLFEGDMDIGERSPDAWGALAAWGWGASRVMDYFETDSRIDTSKVALLGHSRGGKASLWTGAEDDRFSLVISNESGAGGAAISRRTYGETVEAVNRFTHWFADNFNNYNNREDELPVDQHMLIGLIAPRAVYIASADEDLWADPRGEFLSLVHASPVYGLWGHEPVEAYQMPPLDQPLFAGPRGYHVRTGGHNLTPADWNHYMDFASLVWQQP